MQTYDTLSRQNDEIQIAVDLESKHILEGRSNLQSLVQRLGTPLVSSVELQRQQGALLLAQVTAAVAHQCDAQERAQVADFFIARLADWPCQRASFIACTTLLELGLDDGQQVQIIENMSTKVHAQALAQPDRHLALALLIKILQTCGDTAKSNSLDLVDLSIAFIDEEKDPRCLLLALRAVTLLHVIYGFETEDSQPLAQGGEEVMDILSCYFPVSFTPPSNQSIQVTREQLVEGVVDAMVSSPYWVGQALGLAVDKIGSSLMHAKSDSLALLTALFSNHASHITRAQAALVWKSLKHEIVAPANIGLIDAELSSAQLVAKQATETLESCLASESHAGMSRLRDEVASSKLDEDLRVCLQADWREESCEVLIKRITCLGGALAAVAHVDLASWQKTTTTLLPIILPHVSHLQPILNSSQPTQTQPQTQTQTHTSNSSNEGSISTSPAWLGVVGIHVMFTHLIQALPIMPSSASSAQPTSQTPTQAFQHSVQQALHTNTTELQTWLDQAQQLAANHRQLLTTAKKSLQEQLLQQQQQQQQQQQDMFEVDGVLEGKQQAKERQGALQNAYKSLIHALTDSQLALLAALSALPPWSERLVQISTSAVNELCTLMTWQGDTGGGVASVQQESIAKELDDQVGYNIVNVQSKLGQVIQRLEKMSNALIDSNEARGFAVHGDAASSQTTSYSVHAISQLELIFKTMVEGCLDISGPTWQGEHMLHMLRILSNNSAAMKVRIQRALPSLVEASITSAMQGVDEMASFQGSGDSAQDAELCCRLIEQCKMCLFVVHEAVAVFNQGCDDMADVVKYYAEVWVRMVKRNAVLHSEEGIQPAREQDWINSVTFEGIIQSAQHVSSTRVDGVASSTACQSLAHALEDGLYHNLKLLVDTTMQNITKQHEGQRKQLVDLSSNHIVQVGYQKLFQGAGSAQQEQQQQQQQQQWPLSCTSCLSMRIACRILHYANEEDLTSSTASKLPAILYYIAHFRPSLYYKCTIADSASVLLNKLHTLPHPVQQPDHITIIVHDLESHLAQPNLLPTTTSEATAVSFMFKSRQQAVQGAYTCKLPFSLLAAGYIAACTASLKLPLTKNVLEMALVRARVALNNMSPFAQTRALTHAEMAQRPRRHKPMIGSIGSVNATGGDSHALQPASNRACVYAKSQLHPPGHVVYFAREEGLAWCMELVAALHVGVTAMGGGTWPCGNLPTKKMLWKQKLFVQAYSMVKFEASCSEYGEDEDTRMEESAGSGSVEQSNILRKLSACVEGCARLLLWNTASNKMRNSVIPASTAQASSAKDSSTSMSYFVQLVNHALDLLLVVSHTKVTSSTEAQQHDTFSSLAASLQLYSKNTFTWAKNVVEEVQYSDWPQQLSHAIRSSILELGTSLVDRVDSGNNESELKGVVDGGVGSGGFSGQEVEVLVGVLLRMLRCNTDTKIREAGLDVLLMMQALPHEVLHPVYEEVTQSVTQLLDDKKRSVRTKAAQCKVVWGR